MVQTERPVGPKVTFAGAKAPDGRDLVGVYVRLERISAERHGEALWARLAGHDHVWDYLFETPPKDQAEFLAYVRGFIAKDDWLGYAICNDDGPVGYAFYLNIVASMGTIEVGNVNFSPDLQQTPAATEAMYLMMREAFALGYRRYEWKCNALNGPSRRAAQRLGFSWEGIFRQHFVVKGRNRDTAWLAITDQEWPDLDTAFRAWLSSDNFDRVGRQKASLSALTAPHRVSSDPDQTA